MTEPHGSPGRQRSGGRLLATLVLVPAGSDGVAILRQMAVEPACARRELGRALVERAEREALALGARMMRLSARGTAIGVYERLGYRAGGAPCLDVTLPHRAMRKAPG